MLFTYTCDYTRTIPGTSTSKVNVSLPTLLVTLTKYGPKLKVSRKYYKQVIGTTNNKTKSEIMNNTDTSYTAYIQFRAT